MKLILCVHLLTAPVLLTTFTDKFDWFIHTSFWLFLLFWLQLIYYIWSSTTDTCICLLLTHLTITLTTSDACPYLLPIHPTIALSTNDISDWLLLINIHVHMMYASYRYLSFNNTFDTSNWLLLIILLSIVRTLIFSNRAWLSGTLSCTATTSSWYPLLAIFTWLWLSNAQTLVIKHINNKKFTSSILSISFST